MTRPRPFSTTPAAVQHAAAGVAALPEARVREESRRLAPILSDILRSTGRSVVAGTTTREVSDRLVDLAGARGFLPAMLGYHGFPAGAAVSINEEVLHGLPSERALREGDLVKLQFTIVSEAAYAAQGWTFPVGEPRADDRILLEAGPRALRAGLRAVSARGRVGDVGAAIQAEAEGAGLSVVRSFVGYRMGTTLIMAPQIAGVGRPRTGERLREGWILHLHVLVQRGAPGVAIQEDRWTAVAEEGRRGALFTAMVEVTADGHQVLSALLDG
jgi:methionyl aminopeptidase